jgi:nitrite reductase (NADH) small subunit
MSSSMWQTVCALSAITPGTGVCALVSGHQLAIFRPAVSEELFALDNIDPFAQASVLSRGLIAEHQGELWVASPLKKQHFRLRDGHCLENSDFSVASFPVRVVGDQVEVAA